jgi:hypothetical protein
MRTFLKTTGLLKKPSRRPLTGPVRVAAERAWRGEKGAYNVLLNVIKRYTYGGW